MQPEVSVGIYSIKSHTLIDLDNGGPGCQPACVWCGPFSYFAYARPGLVLCSDRVGYPTLGHS